MRVVGHAGFSIAKCVRRVKAARRGLGPNVELMIDAHGSLEVATAIKLAKELEPYDIAWFEEPVGTSGWGALHGARPPAVRRDDGRQFWTFNLGVQRHILGTPFRIAPASGTAGICIELRSTIPIPAIHADAGRDLSAGDRASDHEHRHDMLPPGPLFPATNANALIWLNTAVEAGRGSSELGQCGR